MRKSESVCKEVTSNSARPSWDPQLMSQVGDAGRGGYWKFARQLRVAEGAW